MTEQQLEQAIETISDDPTTITIVDNNGNENQMKTEINEIQNTNETSNNNNKIRRSSRIRSNISNSKISKPGKTLTFTGNTVEKINNQTNQSQKE